MRVNWGFDGGRFGVSVELDWLVKGERLWVYIGGNGNE